jgi:prepilin-type N-terminal cleavage/methylation domain-containing protein
MIRRNKNAGFTLIELMIVVAIIAIIASIAIPKLMSARLSANEAAAISTLRSISSAQAQIQSSGAIDTDGDGGGEYAYFGEMAGTAFLRLQDPAAPAGPGILGVAATDRLNPSVLASAFGNVDAAGRVSRSGYFFAMFLPDATPGGGGAIPGLPENAGGGAGAVVPDANNCEILWCAYAWPMDHNGTGNRAFFINEQGDLLQCQNRSATPFDGATGVSPTFDEVFLVAGDMSSGLNIGAASVVSPNNTWTAVQ